MAITQKQQVPSPHRSRAADSRAEVAREARALRSLADQIGERSAVPQTAPARGTGDVTDAARAARAAAAPTPPRGIPLPGSRPTPARGVPLPGSRVSNSPTSYFVGDEGPTPELIAA